MKGGVYCLAKTFNVLQVCEKVNISIYTLNLWYRYKRRYPEDGLAQLLPDYYKEHVNSQRLWNQSDIKRLIKFKNSIKVGRSGNGNLSKVIQKYVKEKKNGTEGTN